MIRTFSLAVALAATLAQPVMAGLQRWDISWRDSAGNEAPYGSGRAEASANDSRGYTLSIACAPAGGYVMAFAGPPGVQPDFAGPAIQPGLRISVPGTDLFRGTLAMTFGGNRYSGPLPRPVVEPLRKKVRDGVIMLTELGTHTTVKLELQSIERALAELGCG